MRRFRAHYLWLWSVPLLLCAGLAIAGDASRAGTTPTRARMLFSPSALTGKVTTVPTGQVIAPSALTGKVTLSRTSPALSGLKLLEDILGRVRSVPQVAMNVKQNLQNQRQEIAQQAQQGPTNYQLAIRPNESSWRQQQKLNAMANKPSGPSGFKSSSAKRKGIWEKEDDDSLDGASARSQSDVVAYGFGQDAFVRGSQANTANTAAAPSSGIWEAEKKEAQLTPAQERLKNAAGKLYGLSRKLETANEIASSNTTSTFGGYAGGYGGGGGGTSANSVRGTTLRTGGLRKDALDKVQQYYKAPQQFQIVDDAPRVRDYRHAPEEANQIQLPANPYPASPGGMVPPPPAVSLPKGGPMPRVSTTYGTSSNIAHLPAPRLGESAFDEGFYGDAGLPGDRESRVAMLPPNVFTGIPMVKLGISEKQAARALAASGSMERQRINGWTVWTCFKPGTREPALQVYMRHGQVDAVRTFDAALVGSDFGVRLGDSLAAVKERFGEPAFIIPEPTPGAGQNYVYPISQVAFLIARPAPNTAPQVTGLFIFNVK